jgi:translation initiation factor 3 subunit C
MLSKTCLPDLPIDKICLPQPHATMSRFFHGGDSDSESSSSEEEELYSDHGEREALEEESDAPQDDSEEESSSDDDEVKGTGANRFLKPSGGGAEDSDESEDEDKVTVVKSAKDKRLEELEGTIRLIENAEKINDWAVISTGMSCHKRPCEGCIPELTIIQSLTR